MAEEKAEPKAVKKETKVRTFVVAQLPQQSVNAGKDDNGEFVLMTYDEALTEILEKIRKLEKNLG